MGFIFSKAWRALTQKKQVRLLMIGLDGAGKTTILQKMKFDELVRTIPTIGFNVESLDYKGLNFTIWDIGGQDNIRVLWKHYYQNTDGLIFVVDSNDRDRIKLAAEELNYSIGNDELKTVPILVLANKQDIRDSYSPQEVTDFMGLKDNKTNKWLVQGSSAVTGQGITQGFDWLADTLLKGK
jgi:ADP-ribosylation factor protein 1